MLVRSVIFTGAGLLLVVLSAIANTRLGWSIDMAWLLVASAAFAWPPEVSPLAGIVFGLVLDALSGTFGIYTLAYGGFGAVLLFLRKMFYLENFMAAWVISLAGCELLWLFLRMVAGAINKLGGAAKVPGIVSPFLIGVLIGFPVLLYFTRRLLKAPVDKGRRRHYGATTRVIDKT